MKLPYGISDFKIIRNEKYLYVDKTKYIEELERIGRYLFFIRPRRFGKSLFLSTMDNYYDLKNATEFAQLFHGLYMGKNPTTLKNTYFILKLNFSGLNTSSEVDLKNSFTNILIRRIVNFFYYYKEYLPDSVDVALMQVQRSADPRDIMEILFNEVERTPYKIYLIIDEYDHFANDIIAMGDGDYYHNIIHASSFVRDFYETVKIGTQGIIDRIFITGISPIMLDDLTSGFNIATNITMEAIANEMLGFTEAEVNEIVRQIGEEHPAIADFAKGNLKEYYNGYLFNEDCARRVYNPDMVLYYFDYFLRNQRPPKNLIDDNVKTDYGRLNRLIANKVNREILREIIANEYITADIVTKFSFERMYAQDYFVSLLFYLGLLTIDQQIRTRLLLRIPNFVIRTVFWNYFREKLVEEHKLILETEELRKAIEALAYDGVVEPYIEFINRNILQSLSNRDLIKFDEKYLKVILFSFLIPSNIYKPISEREVESGYIDIFLEKDSRFPDAKYEWIWELKYVKKGEEHRLSHVKEEGITQLKRYASSEKFSGRANLRKVLIIFLGKGDFVVYTLD